jgi:hypothetical protein
MAASTSANSRPNFCARNCLKSGRRPLPWLHCRGYEQPTTLFDGGSCVASVPSSITAAHSSDQLGCDPLRIDHGFIGRHIEMQVLLVDAPERPEVRAKRRAGSFTGVAVDLAAAVPVIIPGPFADAVADRGMGWVTTSVALPLIGIQLCAAHQKVFHHELMTRPSVRVVAHPKTLLARVAGDDADDGKTIIGIRAVPLALIGASPRWVTGIAMGRAFFPPRSGRVRRPQMPCRS